MSRAGELYSRIKASLDQPLEDMEVEDSGASILELELHYWTGETRRVQIDWYADVGYLKDLACAEYSELQIASSANRNSSRLPSAADIRLEWPDGGELLDSKASMLECGAYNEAILVVLPKKAAQFTTGSTMAAAGGTILASSTPAVHAGSSYTPFRSPNSLPPMPITAGPFRGEGNRAGGMLLLEGRSPREPPRPSGHLSQQYPEEWLFHAELDDIYESCRGTGTLNVDPVRLKQLLGNYLEVAAESYEAAAREQLTCEQLNPDASDAATVDALCARAERDTWCLLQRLTAYNQLGALSATRCSDLVAKHVEDARLQLPHGTMHDYTVSACERIDVCVKGRAVVEWFELCGQDLHPVVLQPPPDSEPWEVTANRIISGGRSGPGASMSSVHPDAQLSQGFGGALQLLPLDGVDADMQTEVLQALWGLVRSGQLGEAQRYCLVHRYYWLAASLQGATDCYYETNEIDGGATSSRVGNLRRPLWLKLAYNYANRLSGLSGASSTSSSSITDSRARVLEMTIYAALSFNLPILLSSPLCASPEDRLWAVLKCSHERDLMLLVHSHRLQKQWQREHKQSPFPTDSGRAAGGNLRDGAENAGFLYPDADSSIVAAEREMIDVYTADLARAGLIARNGSHPCVWVDERISAMAAGNRKAFYLGLGLAAGDSPLVASSAATAAYLVRSHAPVMRSVLATLATGAAPSGSDIAGLFVELQLALIHGPDGLRTHLEHVVLPVVEALRSAQTSALSSSGNNSGSSGNGVSSSFGGSGSRLLRTYVHVLLWMRHSPAGVDSSQGRRESFLHPAEPAPSLPSLVSDRLLYGSLECYLHHLTFVSRQHELVALYTVFLSRARRVHCYSQLLLSLSGSLASQGPLPAANSAGSSSLTPSGLFSSVDARRVLEAARCYFEDASEVADVLQIVSDPAGHAAAGAGAGAGSALEVGGSPRSVLKAAQTPAASVAVRDRDWSGSLSHHQALASGGRSVTFALSPAPPSSYVSAIEAGPGWGLAQQQQLDALHWLLLEREHRCEAVRKSNVMLLRQLSEGQSSMPGTGDGSGAGTGPGADDCPSLSPSFLMLLRKLLEDHLPADSITVGDAVQIDRVARVEEDAAARAIAGSVAEAQSGLQLRLRDAALSSEVWAAHKTLHVLFRGILHAMGDLDAVRVALAALEADVIDSEVRFGGGAWLNKSHFEARLAALDSAAKQACAMIRLVLTIDTSSAACPASRGLHEVFVHLEMSVLEQLCLMVDIAEQERGARPRANNSANSAMNMNVSSAAEAAVSVDDFLSLQSSGQLVNRCLSLSAEFEVLCGRADGAVEDKRVHVLSKLAAVEEWSRTADDSPAGAAERAALESLLTSLSAGLSDVIVTARSKGAVAHSLVEAHLDLCRTLAHWCRRMQDSTRERAWLGRSLELGSLVAKDGPDGTSKIYSLLSRAQCVSVVDRLELAAGRKLTLESKFDFI